MSTLVLFSLVLLTNSALGAGEMTATRTISNSHVAPGDSFTVTIEVSVNEPVYAIVVTEFLPDNWVSTAIDNDGMNIKSKSECTKWSNAGLSSNGESKTIEYSVTVPDNATNGIYSFYGNITGYHVYGIDTEGDTQVTVGEGGNNNDVAADFSANVTSGKVPLAVQFTDASTGASSWKWDFDNDGVTDSTEQNPVHTYDDSGTFSVKLEVSDGSDSDAETKTDYITVESSGSNGGTGGSSTALVTADFSANVTSGIAPLAVQFTDASTNASSWKWDFDNDGVVDSTEQNPVHTYDSTGTYSVKLEVSNGSDNDTETKSNYITITSSGSAVTADFSANVTSGLVPLVVQFTDASTNASSWEWDFDNDGVVDSTEQNPVYMYNKSGTYSVKLEVSDGNDSDTETKNSYIKVGSEDNSDKTQASSISLSATIIPCVSIEVTPGAIDFGNLAPGETSDTKQIKIKNKGAKDATITAEVLDVAQDLYVNGFKLDSETWQIFSKDVSSGSSETVDACLEVPSDFIGIGSMEGKVVFWAELE